jgi:hypothetical protein
MAIANVGTRGTQVSSTANTTVARAPSATVAVGRVLFCWVAQNGNRATTVTDAVGNTWEFIGSGSNTAGNARSDLWMCNVTNQLTTANTITVTFAANVTHKSMALWEYSVAAGAILVESATPVPNESTGTGFGSVNFAGLPSLQRLYFRALAKQANNTGTITSANGFTSHALNIRSQNNASAIAQRGEYRINTSTGETSNPTWAITGNTGNVFAAFEEFTPPTPVDLTGNSAAQPNTSTNGAISQTHELAGNSVAQDNTSTNGAVSSQAPAIDTTGNSAAQPNTSNTGAISQTHIALGASAAQPNTSNTGAIGQTHVLLGASVAQDNAATAGAVSQTYILTGASAAQVNTSTNGAVSQTPTYFLTGESAAQANTSTTGAVSSVHAVAGNSVAQANTSNTGAVSQTHVLAGASAAQTNTATAGQIIVFGDLIGASAAQPNTSTTGSVSQTHVLAGASAAQTNASTNGAISSEAPAVNLSGLSSAQPNTSATGAVVQVHLLVGNPVAVDNVATASGIVQTHLLTGDWVEPGWVEGGWVRYSSVVQINTSGPTPDAFSQPGRARLGQALAGAVPARVGGTPLDPLPVRLGLPAAGASPRIGGSNL